jgi:hypothetical protein
MTESSLAIPAKEYYAKRVRHYLAVRGLDEEVLAAQPISPAGLTKARQTRDIGGVLGEVIGGNAQSAGAGRGIATEINARRDAGVDRTAGPDLPVPKSSMLVLTSGRLLVFSIYQLGIFNAKPKSSKWDIPLADVVWVSQPSRDSGIGLVKVLRVEIGVSSGHVLRVEFPQVVAEKGASLVAELARRIRPSTADA